MILEHRPPFIVWSLWTFIWWSNIWFVTHTHAHVLWTIQSLLADLTRLSSLLFSGFQIFWRQVQGKEASILFAFEVSTFEVECFGWKWGHISLHFFWECWHQLCKQRRDLDTHKMSTQKYMHYQLIFEINLSLWQKRCCCLLLKCHLDITIRLSSMCLCQCINAMYVYNDIDVTDTWKRITFTSFGQCCSF